MQAYEIADLLATQAATGRAYHEFINIPALSVGLYTLPAGGTDPQQPHSEDEVYYVVSGRAVIQVGDEDQPVTTGSVVLVTAGVPHHFHSITVDLTVLVFFAPAEYSLAPHAK